MAGTARNGSCSGNAFVSVVSAGRSHLTQLPCVADVIPVLPKQILAPHARKLLAAVEFFTQSYA
eukprot:6183885-Pleurochrysis_carterae.AAC.1